MRFPVAVLLLVAASAPAMPMPALAAHADAAPYLKRDARPDETALLPAPPAAGSPEDAADRATYAATRALRDTPRWALAAADADRRPAAVLADFGCALGARIDPTRAPALMALLSRSYADVEKDTKGVKALYARVRPLAGNALPICEPRDAHLETSFSYPSGHATQGWVAALILARLAPDRAGAILARGRVYGDSRAVCGSHWPSDVAAARRAGDDLFAALERNPAFAADMATARTELPSAGIGAPAASTCAVEAEAAAHPIVP